MNLADKIKRFNDTGEYAYLSHVMKGYTDYEAGKEFTGQFKESFAAMSKDRFVAIRRSSNIYSNLVEQLEDFNEKHHSSLEMFLGQTSLDEFYRFLSVSLLLIMAFEMPKRIKVAKIDETKVKKSITARYEASFHGIYPYLTEERSESSDDTLKSFALIYKNYIQWVGNNIIHNRDSLWKENLEKLVTAFNRSFSILCEISEITEIQEEYLKRATERFFEPFVKVSNFLLIECFQGTYSFTENWLLGISPNVQPFPFLSDQLTMKPNEIFELKSQILLGKDFCVMPLEVKAVFDDIIVTPVDGSQNNFKALMGSSVFSGIMDQCLRYSIFRGAGLGSVLFANGTKLIFITCEVDFEFINIESNGKIYLKDEIRLQDGEDVISKRVPIKADLFILDEIDMTYVSCFIKLLASFQKRLRLLFTGLTSSVEQDLRKTQSQLIKRNTSMIISALRKAKTLEKKEGFKKRRVNSNSQDSGRTISIHVKFENDCLTDYGIISFDNTSITPYRTFEKLGISVPHYYKNYSDDYFGHFRSLIMTLSTETFLKYLIQDKDKSNHNVLKYTEASITLKDHEKIVIKVINMELQYSLFEKLKLFENFRTVQDYLTYGHDKIYKNELKIMMMVKDFNKSHDKSLEIPIPEVLFHGSKFNLYLSSEKLNGYLGPYILMNYIPQTEDWSEILPLEQEEIDEAKSNMERLIRKLNIVHGDIELRNMVYNHRKIYFLDFGSSKIINIEKVDINIVVQIALEKIQMLLGNPYKG